MIESWHGTLNGYINKWCRCDACRAASTAYSHGARQRRVERLAADPTLAEHGNASTYNNWGCRCPACTDAWNVVHRDHYHRKKRGEIRPSGQPVGPLKHGSAYAYNQKRCRCDECRAWCAANSAKRKASAS